MSLKRKTFSSNTSSRSNGSTLINARPLRQRMAPAIRVTDVWYATLRCLLLELCCTVVGYASDRLLLVGGFDKFEGQQAVDLFVEGERIPMEPMPDPGRWNVTLLLDTRAGSDHTGVIVMAGRSNSRARDDITSPVLSVHVLDVYRNAWSDVTGSHVALVHLLKNHGRYTVCIGSDVTWSNTPCVWVLRETERTSGTLVATPSCCGGRDVTIISNVYQYRFGDYHVNALAEAFVPPDLHRKGTVGVHVSATRSLWLLLSRPDHLNGHAHMSLQRLDLTTQRWDPPTSTVLILLIPWMNPDDPGHYTVVTVDGGKRLALVGPTPTVRLYHVAQDKWSTMVGSMPHAKAPDDHYNYWGGAAAVYNDALVVVNDSNHAESWSIVDHALVDSKLPSATLSSSSSVNPPQCALRAAIVF